VLLADVGRVSDHRGWRLRFALAVEALEVVRVDLDLIARAESRMVDAEADDESLARESISGAKTGAWISGK